MSGVFGSTDARMAEKSVSHCGAGIVRSPAADWTPWRFIEISNRRAALSVMPVGERLAALFFLEQ
ncbi:hypothetical protein EBBID32_36440 [Sphingobium indicum BiD32]|uniref:Uncharacterized protein n=1 Tax=Sphingobium indicum BiD32 TaxID=1301087 RepID=N1MVD8_9SPHN|nr:hypothetical protein EBBID32_36440 [Sphingobium indicum BiD32]